MKKVISLLLTMFTLTMCVCTPVLAEESHPAVTVIESDRQEEVLIAETSTIDSFTNDQNILTRAPSSDYDLSNGSLSLDIQGFAANDTRTSRYKYTTNSTQIKVNMRSDISVSVTVYLYDASTDQQLQEKTVNLGTILAKTVTFSNLTSAKKYYFKFRNNGQQTVAITGSISD